MNRYAPIVLALASLAGAAPAVGATVPGTLVVGFERGTSERHVRALARSQGDRVRPLGQAEVVQIEGLRRSAARASERLLRDDAVTFVEPVRTVRRALAPTPDQWGLRNTGQFNGRPAADIDVERAWQAAGLGAGVPVGTIDSGVDFEQPAFADLDIWVNPGEQGLDARGRDKATNDIDDDDNGCVDDVRGCDFVDHDGEPDDTNGHGTSVMSVLAGPATPGPVIGVAPRARIVAARALDDFASGTTAMEANAINYLGRYGARVINISIAGADSLAVRTAIANWPNTLFVVAAGNDGVDDDGPAGSFPCSDPAANILCVGASTPTDTLAAFSNFGALRVDVAAPGERILALKLNGSTALLRGTSFAAPIVSGIAALMLGVAPQATVAQLKDAIKASVEVKPGLSRIRTGGRVNAYNAVQLIRGLVPAPRPTAAVPTPVVTPAPTPAPVAPPPAPPAPDLTSTSGTHVIDVQAKGTRQGGKVTLTLRCTGASECSGSLKPVTKGARATSFALAAGGSQRVTVQARLAKRTKRLAVAVTVDRIAVRHTVTLG